MPSRNLLFPWQPSRPWGLEWRSSSWFVTLVVGFGIMTDVLVYSIIIPVIPFQLQRLGHHDVASLTAWLLVSYSLGVVLSTLPIAWLTEKYNARRWPLLGGLFALMAFMAMFMEAPNYTTMVIARFIQGISSSVVWVVALSLLCDTVPEENAGRQIGFALTGLPVGVMFAPPIGGFLFDRLGFRAPFIFGIGAAALDLIGRLVVIDRKEALKWNVDPVARAIAFQTKSTGATVDMEAPRISSVKLDDAKEKLEICNETSEVEPRPDASASPKLSLFQALMVLIRSPRTLSAIFIVFVFGISITAFEPTIPLRVQDVWHLNPTKVGLVYLTFAVPTLIAAPLSGYLSDRIGAEWVIVVSSISTIPWILLLTIRHHLALFISCFAIGSFFLTAIVSPVTAEFASVTRVSEGVGFGHIYGAYNIAYGVGSAVGPIVAGEIYDHAHRGWLAVCYCVAAAQVLSLCCAICFTGERPLIQKSRRMPSSSTTG